MFKAGDRVRRVKDSHFGMKVDDVATVDHIGMANHVVLREFEGEHSVKCLELLTDGPVRTVTRREIVPGTYGKINVLAASRSNAVIQLLDSTGIEATKAIALTAEELREAAHLFSQLAEVLEESNANPR